jgi:hypothetical protein
MPFSTRLLNDYWILPRPAFFVKRENLAQNWSPCSCALVLHSTLNPATGPALAGRALLEYNAIGCGALQECY